MMKNIFTHGSFLFLIKLLTAGLSFLFFYLAAQQLSAAEFGLLSLALTCLLFSTAFAKQGLEFSVVKFSALLDAQKLGSFYVIVFCYALISSLVILVCLLLLAEPIANIIFEKNLLADLLPLVAVVTLGQVWLSLNSSFLKGCGHATSSVCFQGGFTFTFVLVLICIYPQESAAGMLKFLGGAIFIASVLSMLLVIARTPLLKGDIRLTGLWQLNRELSSKGFIKTNYSLFYTALAALVVQQASVLILARYETLAMVGVYSLALKASLLLSYPLVAINAITAPMYAKYFSNGQTKEFRRLASTTRMALTGIATIGCLVLWLAIDGLVGYLGDEYLSMAGLIKILMIGQWFNLATGSVVVMLLMTGYEKLHQRNIFIINIANIGLLFLLLPSYGAYAAAWITTITMSVTNLVSLWYTRKIAVTPST